MAVCDRRHDKRFVAQRNEHRGHNISNSGQPISGTRCQGAGEKEESGQEKDDKKDGRNQENGS